MKNYPLLFALLCVGCATQQPLVEQRIVIVPDQRPDGMNPYDASRVRYPERLKQYPVGRYIDPGDRTMHEAHVVYRQEKPPKWNLKPNAPTAVQMGPVVAVHTPNRQVAPLTAELEQKISEQNQLFQATISQNQQITEQLADLQLRIRDTTAAAASNPQLIDEQQRLQAKIDALNQKLEQNEARSNAIERSLKELRDQREIEKTPAPPTRDRGLPAPILEEYPPKIKESPTERSKQYKG